MVKRNKGGRKGGGSGGSRSPANQSTPVRSNRSPRKTRSERGNDSELLSFMKNNAPLTVGFALLVLAMILFISNIGLNVFLSVRDDIIASNGQQHHIPHIDGIPIELDAQRGNSTQDFLNNFVCKYQPSSNADDDKDSTGYCHSMLEATPHYRTQRVPISNSEHSVHKLMWKNLLQLYLPTSFNFKKVEDIGIQAGELVMKLPRPLQIWDLDALRDMFIQHEFLGFDTSSMKKIARHKDTQNPLDSGAYLAVYLIRLLHASKKEEAGTDMSKSIDQQCKDTDEGGEECNLQLKWDDTEQHSKRIKTLTAYLDILPTIEDRHVQSSSQINNNLHHDHPLFLSPSTLESLFPKYTHTYDLIRHYQLMIESEYEALTSASEEFGKNVKVMEYLNMRINVLSRAFGVQTSSDDKGARWGVSGDTTKGLSLMNELQSYKTSNFGSSLEHIEVDDAFKLRSMCPLLDMYNSHPNPNVDWRYESKTSSYIIRATKESKIPPGHSIVVSYGKYTDGHLYSKFGYVNGDGSSPTETSLAVFHRMLGNVGLGRQFSFQVPFEDWGSNNARDETKSELAKRAFDMQAKELLRYLMFDDGYKDCIDLTVSNSGSTADEELKLLKLKHLIKLANHREAWTIRMPPKFPSARPYQAEGRHEKNENDAGKSVEVKANRLITICRLLSLRVDDVGGDVIIALNEGLTSSRTPDFLTQTNSNTLEYRAMMCMVRLCNVALGRYIGHDSEEPEIVGSREWNAWYIVSGELRALGILQQAAAREANRIKHIYQKSTNDMENEAMTVREDGACPLEYSLPLLKRI